MKAIGIDLPSTGNVFLAAHRDRGRAAVGIGVTLVAAITPALRATRVTPMAALLEAELPERQGQRAGCSPSSPPCSGSAGVALVLRRPVRRDRVLGLGGRA